jgi:hypothetical protein
MRIKLWMTKDEGDSDYQFWLEIPRLLKADGSWVETLFSDPPAFMKCSVFDVPEHLQFPPGCKCAIRLVELDIAINGVEEAEK